MKKIFLTAEWRKLAMANYEVNPKALKNYLPFKTELDLWEGKCYVSLVGFMFIDTKVKGFSIPFHRNFEEVNLRFYVKYIDQKGELKRGVVFIKELVPKPAITFVANTLFKEKYQTLPMKHRWQEENEKLEVEYQWKYKGVWNSFNVRSDNKKEKIPEYSMEEFILEHYWGYAKVSEDITSEYEVGHPKWEIYRVKSYDVKVNFAEIYGEEFSSLNHQEPKSVYLAEGSEIFVRDGNKL